MSVDQGPITVFFATDSFLVGYGLAALTVNLEDIKVVGRAGDHEELVELVGELHPEAVIIERAPSGNINLRMDHVATCGCP